MMNVKEFDRVAKKHGYKIVSKSVDEYGDVTETFENDKGVVFERNSFEVSLDGSNWQGVGMEKPLAAITAASELNKTKEETVELWEKIVGPY